MATNKLQWKRIAKGDKLPCQSFLRKKNGEILKLSTVAGVTVGQDAYYLPVDDVIEEIKNYPIEESEDEKMIKYFKDLAPFDKAEELYEKYGFSHKDAIAWLEKQGEHAKFRDSIQVGDKVTRNEDGVLVNLSQLKRVAKPAEVQGEQKPTAWSEEDKNHIETLLLWLRVSLGHEDKSLQDKINIEINWLKSLKDRVQPQPKQEWSEEDENLLKLSVENLTELKDRFGKEYGRIGDCIDWLKSLRPQTTWKPSGEQMDALYTYIYNPQYFNSPDPRMELVESVYKDLKKLREE